MKPFPGRGVCLHQADGLITASTCLLNCFDQSPKEVAVDVIGAGSGLAGRNFVECFSTSSRVRVL